LVTAFFCAGFFFAAMCRHYHSSCTRSEGA
jgi:hypothetical protein